MMTMTLMMAWLDLHNRPTVLRGIIIGKNGKRINEFKRSTGLYGLE